jgi:hypothetical protein
MKKKLDLILNYYDLESEMGKKEYLIKEIVPYSMHEPEKAVVYA